MTGILITFIFAASIAALFIFLATVLGPKRPNPAKAQPFECGEKPFASEIRRKIDGIC